MLYFWWDSLKAWHLTKTNILKCVWDGVHDREKNFTVYTFLRQRLDLQWVKHMRRFGLEGGGHSAGGISDFLNLIPIRKNVGMTQIPKKILNRYRRFLLFLQIWRKYAQYLWRYRFVLFGGKTKLKAVVGILKIIDYSRLLKGSHPITYINSGQIGSYLGGF